MTLSVLATGISDYLSTQPDWVPKETLINRGLKKGYKYERVQKALKELENRSNIGYTYKDGYKFYEWREEFDRLNQSAIDNF